MWNCFSLFFGFVTLLIGRLQPLKMHANMPRAIKLQRSPLIFITDIAAILSTVFFLFGFCIRLYEIYEKNNQNKSKFFRKLRDFYKKNLPFVLILNATVSFGYWGMYGYDKKLLSPKIADPKYKIPFWKNCTDHSVGLIVTILEIIFYNFELTNYTFFVTVFTTIAYYADIVIYNHIYNVWPYTLFLKLSKPMVFFYCVGFLAVGSIAALSILGIIRYFKKPEKEQRLPVLREITLSKQ